MVRLVLAVVLAGFTLNAALPAAEPPLRLAAQKSSPTTKDRYRRLAPGIETTIPIDWDATETVAVHDVVDILNRFPELEWTPNDLPKSATLFEKSKSVSFRRAIWNLEFTFKPLRLIRIDVPRADGRMHEAAGD